MTPERKKWWDSLPANEKGLRESLKIHRNLLSFNKAELTNNKDSAYISKWVRREKVLIKALKHELDRTTVAVNVGRLEEGVTIYRCEKCDGMFENFEQTHCCWCGREIKEWKNE